MRSQDEQKIKAFIAAPLGESLDTVKDELAKRNVHAYTTYELPMDGASTVSHVEQAIREADLMVAVIPEQASGNVFFELGIAHAMRKPLLVLVSPTFGALPSDLAATFYLRIAPDNRSALSFALDQCLNRLSRPSRRRRKGNKKEEPIGTDAVRFLSVIENQELGAAQLENLVADVFRAAGAQTVIESQHHDVGADIALWSDALQPIAGNPVLVEVKRSIRSREELQRAIHQIDRYRQKSGSKLVILVVHTVTPNLFSVPVGEGILVVLLTDLIERLRTKTLSETIRELRNESMHSGGN